MVSVHQASRASYLNTHFSTTFGVLFDKRDKLLLFHNTVELERDIFPLLGFFFCKYSNFTFCSCQFQIFWTSSCFFHGNVNRNRYIEIVAFWWGFFLGGAVNILNTQCKTAILFTLEICLRLPLSLNNFIILKYPSFD